MKTATLVIRTPEGIAFPLLLASPVARCLAWSVDFACMLAILIALGYVVSLFGYASEGAAMAVAFLAYFAVTVGYGIALEWLWRGCPIAK